MIAYTLSFITLVLNKMHYSANNNNMLMQPMHAVYGTCVPNSSVVYYYQEKINLHSSHRYLTGVNTMCGSVIWNVSPNALADMRKFQYVRPCEVKVYLKGPAPKRITKWSRSSSANHMTETTVFPALSTNQKWQNTKKHELQLVSKQKGEGTNIWQSYFWSWNNVLDVLLCCLPRRR